MFRLSLCAIAALAALPAHHAQAQNYKFKSIKYGKGVGDGLAAINNAGTIVGGYFQAIGDVRTCFVLTGKIKTALSDPKGKGGTECWDINTAGDIVGDYIDKNGNYNGYLYSAGAGTFTDITPPGSTYTVVYGLNDSDTVIGYYLDKKGNSHGFLFDGTTYTKIDIKGGTSTQGFGINNAGDYTASTVLSDGNEHGYLYVGKTQTELVFPNYVQVAAHHLNSKDQVSATIIDGSGNYSGGVFDAKKNAYYAIGYPKAAITIMDGINDKGTLVGRYQISSSSQSYGWEGTGKLPHVYTPLTARQPATPEAGGSHTLPY